MKKKKMRGGFTLLELMVVLVILGLMAVVVGPNVIGYLGKGQVTKAKTDIKNIESALQMYRIDNGMYPTTEQGLKALFEKPEIDPIPNNWGPDSYLNKDAKLVDPWGNEYIYRSPTEVEDREYEIISYGADGREGGEGTDADIATYNIN